MKIMSSRMWHYIPTCVHCYIPEDHNLKMTMHLWWGQCKDWKNKYVKFEVFIAVLLIEVFWNVQAMLAGNGYYYSNFLPANTV